jgi:hypothetical protein
MKSTPFKMTLFQHALNPIICIGMSDGKITENELSDLKSSTSKLAVWFQITPEQAWRECEELFHHLNNEVSGGDSRSIYLRVPISCALVHKNLKSIDGRNYLIRFLEDQATADGELTDDERQLINMYSTIINLGGKASGIHV